MILLCYITEGYALTEEDFAHGHEIDIKNETPTRTYDPLTDTLEHGHGNYQGDMVLTPDQQKQILGEGDERALWQYANFWPHDGDVVNIPYIITDTTFSSSELAHIARAMEDYETNTCIRYET